MLAIAVVRFTRQELQAIDDAIEHLNRAFVGKINVQDLSDSYHIPVKKLQAGIVKRTGLTVHAYIEAARLEQAKELLAGEAPLKSIATLIGYRTASQFGYFFKKHTGQTPLEYRHQVSDTEKPVDFSSSTTNGKRPNMNKS